MRRRSLLVGLVLGSVAVITSSSGSQETYSCQGQQLTEAQISPWGAGLGRQAAGFRPVPF